MSLPVIAVDVSQCFNAPHASGIQRVLAGLSGEWPEDLAQALFVYSYETQFRAISARDLNRIVEGLFSQQAPPSHWRDMMSDAGTQATIFKGSQQAILDRVDAWLLPELAPDTRILRNFDFAAAQVPAALIFYDAIPETMPESFPLNLAYTEISRYFRRSALAPITVSISQHSDDVLRERLRRPTNLISRVAHPGGDHIPVSTSPAPATPVFSIVGTLEPRKRHLQIVESFVQAEPDLPGARLVLAGRRQSAAKAISEQVARAQAAGSAIEWLDSPSDADIRTVYETS
ncbi:MAG: hypothetical protein WCI74_18030, partial [Actinomycetes bacterium]